MFISEQIALIAGIGKIPAADEKMANYASDIRIYLRQRPILRRYLKEGEINCSALAKKIAKEVYGDKKAEIAIRAALLRESNANGEYEKIEEAALRVLKNSTIEVRTGLCVALSQTPLKVPVVIVSTSKSGIMSVIEGECAGNIKNYERLVRNVDMLTICSGKAIEGTPGAVSLILNTLAQEGINLVEVISCHYDTLLVVNSHDTQRTFQILQELVAKKTRI